MENNAKWLVGKALLSLVLLIKTCSANPQEREAAADYERLIVAHMESKNAFWEESLTG